MAGTLKQLTLDDAQEIMGRALIDIQFRTELAKDAAQVLLVLGYEATDESLTFFRALVSDSFQAAAAEVEGRLGGRPVVAAWF